MIVETQLVAGWVLFGGSCDVLNRAFAPNFRIVIVVSPMMTDNRL
jgi:hypothetical protein